MAWHKARLCIVAPCLSFLVALFCLVLCARVTVRVGMSCSQWALPQAGQGMGGGRLKESAGVTDKPNDGKRRRM